MTYEVQTLTYVNTWENTWTDDDTPAQFGTYAEAAAELAAFLDDMQHAAKNNFLSDYNASDYRIKKL